MNNITGKILKQELDFLVFVYLKKFIYTKIDLLGMPSKKNYVDRETVPIPSYPPTIETVSKYLDREYW